MVTNTDNTPVVLDASGPVAIGAAVEFSGFAFGTYDVDVTTDQVTMTLLADLGTLLITNYDASPVDRYYFKFDAPIAGASIASSTPGFAAMVEIIAPGTTARGAALFGLGLPTSFDFGNGR